MYYTLSSCIQKKAIFIWINNLKQINKKSAMKVVRDTPSVLKF